MIFYLPVGVSKTAFDLNSDQNMQSDLVYSVVGNMAAAGLVTTKVGSIMRTD